METSTPKFLLSVIAIDFNYVFNLEYESIKEVLRLVEASILKKFFFASSQEIYSCELLCIYENISIFEDRKILMTIHDHILVVSSLFQLPSEEISSFSEFSALGVEEMQVKFSTSEKLVKLSMLSAK